MTKKKLASLALGTAMLTGGAQAADTTPRVENALVIVNSGELQTQGMAMILANAMQAQGTHINILLCDKAGDLALQNTQNPPLKPKGVTPEQLLTKLQQAGAQVDVCALYLPNSEHDQAQLREGVGVATPDNIAQHMTNITTRVFNF
ncbi:MAG: hypothetical protein ACTHY5_10165 [Oceanisphaera sp.]|uniref:hypothetical protein n=1 Tax=Oceanisphaera sp. TaxID=1929979 RepID=UPI003F961F50